MICLFARGFYYWITRESAGIELLKPGFFTAAPTTDELTYHAANTDSLGIAMQILDINDDGIDDYKVISATTVQIMYGVE